MLKKNKNIKNNALLSATICLPAIFNPAAHAAMSEEARSQTGPFVSQDVAKGARDKNPNARSPKLSEQSKQIEPDTENKKGKSEVSHRKSASDAAEEIVVTGSRIRGNSNTAANLHIYGSKEIEQSGYATVQDFIQTLPQNYQGGGGAEDSVSGDLITSNRFSGATVNLRGLGSDSTLVLINGRRVAPSGLSGTFTDISIIPQTAIERIEVLADSASALYGSDAVGGVVNFILRKDYSGVESRVRYGRTTEGEMDEYRLAQIIGKNWDGGSALISYEYYQRGNLSYDDRSFAQTSDLRSRGGDDHRVFYGSPGTILDPDTGMPAYAVPTGQDGSALEVDDLISGGANYRDTTEGADILPQRKQHSIFFTIAQDVNDAIEASVEARYHHRRVTSLSSAPGETLIVPSTNPFFVDPFNRGYTVVAYSFHKEPLPNNENGRVEAGYINGGVKADIGPWRSNSFFSYSRERSKLSAWGTDYDALNAALADPDPATALNPFGDGSVNNPETLQKIRIPTRSVSTIRLINLNSTLDGPLVDLNGKAISLAFGADYRREKIATTSRRNNIIDASRNLTRNIYAGFAELYIPIVNTNDEIAYVNALDLSLAGRIDDYSDVGNTTNPKIMLQWKPYEFVAANISYGKSFRAPNLTEKMSDFNYSSNLSIPDPRSPTGFSQTLQLYGTDPNLKPEKATTWTASLKLEPPNVSGLRINIGFFSTKFKNRIGSPADFYTILLQENYYPSIIIRNPSDEQIEEVCRSDRFFGDISQCVAGNIKAIIDARTQNLMTYKVRGLDTHVAYFMPTNFGNVGISVDSTYTLDYIIQPTEQSPSIDHVNTIGNPPKWRLRSILTLTTGALSGAITFNHIGSYNNTQSTVQDRVNSHQTLDVNIGLNLFEAAPHLLKNNITLSLSVLNILNNKPPFVDSPAGIGFDPDNADAAGRLLSLELKLIW